MDGDERRRLRRIAAALVIVLPRCAALPHCATGRTPPRPGLHHGGPLGRHHPGPAKLPLRAVQAVRGGNGGGAERAAAQCEQRPSSAVYSHERSEVDGILIRFAELRSCPWQTAEFAFLFLMHLSTNKCREQPSLVDSHWLLSQKNHAKNRTW